MKVMLFNNEEGKLSDPFIKQSHQAKYRTHFWYNLGTALIIVSMAVALGVSVWLLLALNNINIF